MTQTSDINEIKRLLALFYEGQTTPEDEARLTSFFLNAEAVEPSLEPDRQLFVALHAASTAEPPADLQRRIVAATCGKRRIYFRYLAAAVLAAAIVVGALVFSTHRATSSSLSESESAVAVVSVDTLRRGDASRLVAQSLNSDTSQVEVEIMTAISAYNEEITPTYNSDSARVAAVLSKVDRRLAKCFANAREGFTSTQMAFNRIDNNINKITQ